MTDQQPIRSARFEIHKHTINRPKETGGCPRTIYHAWFHTCDVPKPVCIVTINRFSTLTSSFNYVEWIHVDEDFRRQGIATETLASIASQLGRLLIDGATDEGEAFCSHFQQLFPELVAGEQ